MNIVNKLNHVEINVRYRQLVKKEIIDQNIVHVSVMILFFYQLIHSKTLTGMQNQFKVSLTLLI